MTNLRTDEMTFFRNLTKIGTDENRAIYINQNISPQRGIIFELLGFRPLFDH